MVSLSLDPKIHLFYRVRFVFSLIDNTPIVISFKYAEFADIFFSRFTTKLLQHSEINNNSINQSDGLQLSYKFIYSLELVELENSKTYNETNLVNDFI